VSFCPRPCGLSGAVMTATILKLFSASMRRLGTAKSGVPMKMIRRSIIYGQIFKEYVDCEPAGRFGKAGSQSGQPKRCYIVLSTVHSIAASPETGSSQSRFEEGEALKE
jgi:hypothetical protein